MDGKPAPKDTPQSFLGYSVGHWEGNTLVVETSHFNDKTPLDFHSSHGTKLKVTERFDKQKTPRAITDLVVEITIDDPEHFTKPFSVPRHWPFRVGHGSHLGLGRHHRIFLRREQSQRRRELGRYGDHQMKFVFKPVLFAVTAAILAGGVSAAESDPWSFLPAAQRPDSGTPNFNGMWAMPTPGPRSEDRRRQRAAAAAGRQGQIRQANQAALKANPKSDPDANCWIQGVPRMIYAPYPMLIAQDKDRVNLVYETNHTFRIVSLQSPAAEVG